MSQRTAHRLAAAAVLVSLAGVTASASPAGAEENVGVGTAQVGSTILDLKLGSLVGVQLLEDLARSTTDAKVAPAEAFSKLTQLRLSSASVPALNFVTPTLEATTRAGGVPKVTSSLLNLGTTVPGNGVAASGTIQPVTLDALLSPSSASSMTAKLTDIGLLSNLAGIKTLTSGERTGSGTAAAEGNRTIAVDALTVLDLKALLAGLGVNLATLPIGVLLDLAKSVGVTLPLPADVTDFAAYGKSLDASLTALRATSSQTVSPIQDQLTSLLPVDLKPLVNDANALVDTVLDTVQSTLASLLTQVLAALDGKPLLELTALDLSATAKATDATSSSVATAAGTIGYISVLGTSLGPVDLAATAAQVNGLVEQVNGALNGALAPLGLGNLLSVKLFDRSTSITKVDGVVKAASSITGLSLKITPPAALTTIISGLQGTPVNQVLTTLQPVVAPVAALSALTGSASPLATGVSLDVAKVVSTAEHRVIPLSTVPGTVTTLTLPRTGGEDILLGFGAAVLAGAGLATRRVVRKAKRAS